MAAVMGTHSIATSTPNQFELILIHPFLRTSALLRAATTSATASTANTDNQQWRVSWVSNSGHSSGVTIAGRTGWKPCPTATASRHRRSSRSSRSSGSSRAKLGGGTDDDGGGFCLLADVDTSLSKLQPPRPSVVGHGRVGHGLGHGRAGHGLGHGRAGHGSPRYLIALHGRSAHWHLQVSVMRCSLCSFLWARNNVQALAECPALVVSLRSVLVASASLFAFTLVSPPPHHFFAAKTTTANTTASITANITPKPIPKPMPLPLLVPSHCHC
jgi:hypothetical protein